MTDFHVSHVLIAADTQPLGLGRNHTDWRWVCNHTNFPQQTAGLQHNARYMPPLLRHLVNIKASQYNVHVLY
jgi:hypothetical protein